VIRRKKPNMINMAIKLLMVQADLVVVMAA